jgi:hypothetical protein
MFIIVIVILVVGAGTMSYRAVTDQKTEQTPVRQVTPIAADKNLTRFQMTAIRHDSGN